ncbi:MAG: rRNA maturation RNase YbeY [bacterium]
MIEVDFTKTVECIWNHKKINEIVLHIAKRVARLKGCVEINIVGEQAMKKINRCYRGLDKPTDVLAFAWQEDVFIKTENLGQIYVCYPQIKRQAKHFQTTVKEEFVRILVHGLLHLVGYDHQSEMQAGKMFALQENIVKEIK